MTAFVDSKSTLTQSGEYGNVIQSLDGEVVFRWLKTGI